MHSHGPISQGTETKSSSSETLLEDVVSILGPPPAVVVVDKGVWSSSSDSISIRAILLKVNAFEIVVLLLVEVGQLPEESNVFKAEVVPLIVVRVVWVLVIVNILTSSKDTLKFDKFPGVNVVGSHSLVLEGSWDPASVNHNSSTLNTDWIVALHKLMHGHLTTFVTVKRVDDLVSVDTVLFLWDEDFL